jgi:ankyrin repeat protein
MNRPQILRGKGPAKRGAAKAGSNALGPKAHIGALQSLESLISEYKEIEKPDEAQVKPKLEKALLSNDMKLFESTLNFHKDLIPTIVNIPNTNTLLHKACKLNSIKGVLFLLKNGSNPNILNPSQKSPLHKAYKSLEIVKILLMYKAQVNLKDCKGCTPLHKAAAYHHKISRTKVLTPAQRAEIDSNVQLIKQLIISGSDLHSKDASGMMPLDYIHNPGLKAELESFYVWHKSKIPLFVYKYSSLSAIPLAVFREIINFI